MTNFGAIYGSDIQAGASRVTNAIATASRSTGVDFGYLMGQAQIESAMNPTARARSSSATGLYQFLDQSWLAVINNHGAEHGLGWAADAIQQGANGHYFVSDPNLRQQILDLRNHPETASVMAAEFAADNKQYIEQRTGRTAEPVDLYLAHFLGAGGAAKFLSAAESNPNGAAADLFPQAARTNRSVFYDRQGNPRSFADIRSDFARKLSQGAQNAGASVEFAGSDGYDLPAGSTQVQPADYVRIAQERLQQSQSLGSATDYPEFQPQAATARLAYLMLDTLGR
jgi:hypothetical protein